MVRHRKARLTTARNFVCAKLERIAQCAALVAGISIRCLFTESNANASVATYNRKFISCYH